MYRVVPEIRDRWEELKQGYRDGAPSGEERTLPEEWTKAVRLLRRDPAHPGLRTHETEALTRRYGRSVFRSYLSQDDKARRLYWVYGPGRHETTIIGLEPHPEDRPGAYARIPLSDLPPTGEPPD